MQEVYIPVPIFFNITLIPLYYLYGGTFFTTNDAGDKKLKPPDCIIAPVINNTR